MRLGNLTGLFCLSFTLLFLCVNSQNCTSGWFGAECNYKCRCENNTCDVSGSCTAPFTCQGGWFGPACQYADLAYLQASLPEVTDGDDSTCNPTKSIKIPLNDTHFFTWMRVIVDDQAQAELDKLAVTFSAKATPVDCDNLKTYVVDKRTVDLHCNLTEGINELTLNAQAVSGLCSVYVSGGRNVAIKENAYQETTFSNTVDGVNHSYPACLAVDGDNNHDFTKLSCSHTDHTPTWTLSLSMPRRVYRYVIYNTDSYSYRLNGFRLRSFDSMNDSVFDYKDHTATQSTYRIIHRPTSIEQIEIMVFNGENQLHMCEFEVYGDSECDHDHYGRDCELSCKCQPLEACFVSAGGCPSGCPTGFHGDGCMIECPAGKFGANCSSSCSPNCKPTGVADMLHCDHVSGNCSNGCLIGFSGSSCHEECPDGTFGANCNSSCSPNCMPTDVEGMSPCDHVTGDCRMGCRDGFSGSHCLKECPAGKFGANCSSSCSPKCKSTGVADMSPCDHVSGNCSNGCLVGFSGSSCHEAVDTLASVETTSAMDLLPIIVGVCLLFAAIAFFGYCFCKKRTAPPSAERKSGSVQPELLK